MLEHFDLVLKEINTKLEIEKSKIGVQKSYIESLQKRNNEDNSEKEKQIEELEKKILNIEQDLIDKGASIDEDNFKSSSTLILEKKTKIREYNRKKAELEAKREQKESEIKFFRENHVCPTCSQSISEIISPFINLIVFIKDSFTNSIFLSIT